MFKVRDKVAYIDEGKLCFDTVKDISVNGYNIYLEVLKGWISVSHLIPSPVIRIKEMMIEYKAQGFQKCDVTVTGTVPATLILEFGEEIINLLEERSKSFD